MGVGEGAPDGSNGHGPSEPKTDGERPDRLQFAADHEFDTKLNTPGPGRVSEESGIRMGWWIAGGVASIALWYVIFLLFMKFA